MIALYCEKCGGLISADKDYPISNNSKICSCKSHNSDNHLQGWECPRCKKIHSPYSLECDCFPQVNTFTCTGTSDGNLLCKNKQ